jgi:hypothetical protein
MKKIEKERRWKDRKNYKDKRNSKLKGKDSKSREKDNRKKPKERKQLNFRSSSVKHNYKNKDSFN